MWTKTALTDLQQFSCSTQQVQNFSSGYLLSSKMTAITLSFIYQGRLCPQGQVCNVQRNPQYRVIVWQFGSLAVQLAVMWVDAACVPLLHELQHRKSRSHPVVDDTPGVRHPLVVHLGISMVASSGCSNSVHFDRGPFHGLGNVHCCQIGHCTSKAVACGF